MFAYYLQARQRATRATCHEKYMIPNSLCARKPPTNRFYEFRRIPNLPHNRQVPPNRNKRVGAGLRPAPTGLPSWQVCQPAPTGTLRCDAALIVDPDAVTDGHVDVRSQLFEAVERGIPGVCPDVAGAEILAGGDRACPGFQAVA